MGREVIIDASVAVKWLVKEALSPKALRLLGRGDLSAPDLVDIEIGQALTRCARQRVLTSAQATGLWATSSDLPLARRPWRDYAGDAFDLSLRLRSTFNDCVYLAMAIGVGEPLITADERFWRATLTEPGLATSVINLADLPD
jgi:predicted nucleic acid-binding protein